ncbi:MAG: hypothetical protein ACYDES_12360 [Acidimicrobiales bacterium]
MTLGLSAALEVGLQLGVDSDDPLVLQESNNTVVWLRPHPVIAKVGTRADGAEGIVREHEVATALCSVGAPVVERSSDRLSLPLPSRTSRIGRVFA